MKSLSRSRFVAAAAVAFGLMGLAGAAQARSNVYFNIDVPGVYAAPQPVYVDPQPVYVDPQPVYVDPQPAYVYTAPPAYAPAWGWREREWRREHWRREQWRREHERREEWREHHGYRHWD